MGYPTESQREPVKIRFQLLPWQVKARELRATRSLVVINSGVFTGKTAWGACELLDDMIHHPSKTFWWVAGLKFQLDAMWEIFAPHCRELGGRVKSHPYLFAQLPNGAKVYGVSAENVEVISAHHPIAIYGDEVAKWREQAWNLVRVRLLNMDVGRGLFLSTPRPNHWREMVRWGREGRDGRWGLVECTTQEAGLVPTEQIEALRRDLPEELFQQEIMARILEGAGMVFHRVHEAAIGEIEEPLAGKTYVIGYDPAKLRDFAVAVVRCEGRVVHVERWKELEYLIQADQIERLARHYNNASVYVDAGGPGQPIYEILQKKNLSVTAVTFTNQNKEEMVNNLVLQFERKELQIPHPTFGPQYGALVDELASFERRRSGSGLHYVYSAPDGVHDDCVSALLLATGTKVKEPAVLTYYRELYEADVAAGRVPPIQNILNKYFKG